MAGIYDFTATSLAGEEVALKRFEGQVLLVVNTAIQGVAGSSPWTCARRARPASRLATAARNGAGSRNGGSDSMRSTDAAT